MKRKKRLRRKEYLALERKKKNRQNKILTGLFSPWSLEGQRRPSWLPNGNFPTGKTGHCSSFRSFQRLLSWTEALSPITRPI